MAPSDEVNAAVGAAAPTLEARRAELRQVVESKSERELAAGELAEVEREIAAREAAEDVTKANHVLKALTRADGSLAQQEEQDDEQMVEAAKRFHAVVTGRMARAQKRSLMQHAARLILEAFPGLEPRPHQPLVVPALSPATGEALRIVGAVRVLDTLYVHREPNYGELASADDDTKSLQLAHALLTRRV